MLTLYCSSIPTFLAHNSLPFLNYLQTLQSKQGKHSFTYDHIFGMDSNQKDVYERVGKPVVEDIFKGYNGTIFVYGQTGSGKT